MVIKSEEIMRKLFCVILFSISSVVAFSQAEIRKYSNEFTNLPPDARGAAMGGAQVASTGDVFSGIYNPAGLAKINSTFQVGFTHSEWFAGISRYDVINFAVPVDEKKRVVGFTFLRFGIDNIPNTLFLVNPDGTINYNNITSFSAADYMFMLHYAQNFVVKKGKLSVGLSPKIIYRHIGKFAKAFGFGIDAGMQYEIKGVKMGLMLKDITTTFNSWSFNFSDAERQVLAFNNNDIPKNTSELTAPMIQFGLGYEASIKGKFFILPEVNFNLSTDGKRNVLAPGKPISLDMNFGLELNYAKIGYLRAGCNNLQKFTDITGKEKWTAAPSLGVGVHIKMIDIGYSFGNIIAAKQSDNTIGGSSHVVSLKLDLNIKPKTKNKKT